MKCLPSPAYTSFSIILLVLCAKLFLLGIIVLRGIRFAYKQQELLAAFSSYPMSFCIFNLYVTFSRSLQLFLLALDQVSFTWGFGCKVWVGSISPCLLHIYWYLWYIECLSRYYHILLLSVLCRMSFLHRIKLVWCWVHLNDPTVNCLGYCLPELSSNTCL